jgi:mRNA interferase RelE/StbE
VLQAKRQHKKTAIKDFKRIDKANLKYLTDSILEFTNNFSFEYEQELLKTGKIKKLQGMDEELYRLKLRTYRVIYKKEEDILIILVVSVKSRENSYKK